MVVAALIADLVAAGVQADLVGRVAQALAQREPVLVRDEVADRRRAYDRAYRKAKRMSGGHPPDKADPEKLDDSTRHPPDIHPTLVVSRVEDNLFLRDSLDISEPNGSSILARSLHKKREANGSRVKADYAPSGQVLTWAANKGFDGQEVDDELEKFRDYWLAQAGARSRKHDWDAAFRTWLGRARDRPRQANGSAKFAAKQANMAAAFRGSEAAIARGRG